MKFLLKHWAKVGGVFSAGIVLWQLLSGSWGNIETLLWLHLAILMVHQFEEYVYPGKFKEFFNRHLYGKGPLRYPLNDYGVLFVNVVIAWSGFLISAIYGTKILWLAGGLLLITFTNGALHTSLMITMKKYNPGALTGLFLFLPFSIYLGFRLGGTMSGDDWLSAIILGILGNASIPAMLFLTKDFERLSEAGK